MENVYTLMPVKWISLETFYIVFLFSIDFNIYIYCRKGNAETNKLIKQ